MSLEESKISIIMPCYNRIKLLDKAIKSILNQTYKNFEFIIVDDSSDFETNILLKKYRDADPRIKLFLNKTNRGPTYTYNKGLYFAKGKFIARMDSDDIAHNNRLEKQIKFLQKNPKVFIVGTAVNFIDDKGEKIKSVFLKNNEHEIIKSLKYSNPLINSTYMANTNIQSKKLLYLNSFFYPADDYYSWYTIIKKNYILTNMPEILLDYRVHESESYKLSRVQGLKTLLVQKFHLLEKKTLYAFFIRSIFISSRSPSEIKSFFDFLPSYAKPSIIEIMVFENNNISEIFKERNWFLLILKNFFNIRSINDVKLYSRFLFRILSTIKNYKLNSFF